ncbi:MAG TPA: hypothetical protein VGS79_28210 [Puia sp.]|nr:hypothetical protein [Puia sp.]
MWSRRRADENTPDRWTRHHRNSFTLTSGVASEMPARNGTTYLRSILGALNGEIIKVYQ